MSSSSTTGRPFTGRLRSSTRPGTAHSSKDSSSCPAASATKTRDGSSESCPSRRFSTSRSASASLGGHTGDALVSASSRGDGCRYVAASHSPSASRVTTEREESAAPDVEGECRLNHGSNGGSDSTACRSLHALGHADGDAAGNASEDKRTARRRRRAEAAAAAAAAALADQKVGETCEFSRGVASHAAAAAGTARVAGHRSSARGRSGAEWKTEVQPRENDTPKLPLLYPLMSSASSVPGESTEQSRLPPEPGTSSSGDKSSRGTEKCGADRHGNQTSGNLMQFTPAVEPASSLADRMSLHAAEGSGVSTQGTPEAGDTVSANSEAGGVYLLLPVETPAVSPTAEPTTSASKEQCVTAERVTEISAPDGPYSVAHSTATGSFVATDGIGGGEPGASSAALSVCGVDSAAASGLSPRGGSVFPNALERCTGGTGPPEGTEQNELSTFSASSSRSCEAESSTEMSGQAEMSVQSCAANCSASCASSDPAKQTEYSASVADSSVAAAAQASEGLPLQLGAVDNKSLVTHVQEHSSTGQVASERLVQGDVRRYKGSSSFTAEEAQHESVPCSLPECSSGFYEKTEQLATRCGSPPAADQSAALLSDKPVLPCEGLSAVSCATSEVHLTPVLHGMQCLRGELLLNREEFDTLQSFLRPLFYRFVPCASADECLSTFHDRISRVHYTCGGLAHQAPVACSRMPVRKEGKPSSRRLAQELHALQQAACAFAALPPRGSKRRRETKLKNLPDDEAEVGSATYSSSHSSGGSFCSVGTHQRDHEGVGEDGEGSKVGDTLLTRETGGRRQQQRTRKLTLRVGEDIEGEEGPVDTIKVYRRGQRVGLSAGEAFERAASVDSDGDVSSAVSGPSRRRIRGGSLWKRRKSVEETCEEQSISSKQHPLHGERQAGRGGAIWERRGGKGSYVEAEAGAGSGSTRGPAVRRNESKAHRRRCLPEENGCEGIHRPKQTEYEGIVEEAQTRMYASRRLWGGKQKKRAGVTAPLSSRTGGNDMGPHVPSTASFSSPVLCVNSTTDWRESCYLILQHLKRQPSARWFLSQDCEAVSSCADPSTQGLSLQEIEQKLTSLVSSSKIREALPMSRNTVALPTASRGKGYVHPSQWQQEVRQIFFNAFTFHPVYHEIWRDAAILAAEFERCCRLVHEVNPYYPAMLKYQRNSSHVSVLGAAGRSSDPNCLSGMSGAPTSTTVNNFSQLPVSYVVYGGPQFEASAKASEARLNFGGSHFFSGTDVAQHPQERVPLIRSQQVQLPHSDPSSYCHHSALLSSSVPGAAAAGLVASGALYEGSATLGYAPGAPFLRGGCGKQHGNSRTGRAAGDGGVRGKRQQQPQNDAAASEGRGDTEDLGVIRKLDGSLVYAYDGQYREMRGGLLGDEGGKNSRVVATGAAGSPRRGGRGGGRGRGTTRGGRGTASTNELHGSAPPQQQLHGRHPWTSIGGHASQGAAVVPERGYLAPLGDLQQQAFTTGGRMLPVGIGSGGQPTSDAGMMLMGGAGLATGTGFTAGATVAGGGASASVLLLSSNSVLEAVQQMEAPVGAPVLPPPPVPRIGVNDKPLSSSQRRTLEQNMQRLSPMQRKAALELIQDDLGILAAEYMNVKAFAFDTELLSIEKQKRLFAYVNSMFRANREILLRQHQQQVAAAQASTMTVAADGAAEALQQESRGVRRGRRKRGEEGIAGEMRGTQTMSGSSSSSSGSDTDSSSSLSSSDTSSSSSSSDTEEEESEGSENESEYCQKTSASATHAASDTAHPGSMSALNTGNGLSSTGTERGRSGTAAGLQDTRAAVRGRGQFSEKTPASSVRSERGAGGQEQESGSRWLNDSVAPIAGEQICRASELPSSLGVAEVMVEGVLQGKDDTSESSELMARQRAAEGADSRLVAGTTRQISDFVDSESPGGGRFFSSSTTELSSPGKCISRGNNQAHTLGVTSRDSYGPVPFHGAHLESPLESGAGVSSCDPTPVSASRHAMSKRPGSRLACVPGKDEAEVADGDKNAAEDIHRLAGRFVGSYGPAVSSKASGSGGRTLPQYTPVCEEGARVEIRAEVMGRHADFLGMLAVREAGGPSENEGARMGDCGAKPTAWQEWKGQVIQQGFVAQRAYASQQQRSMSEIIAEGYNARI